jgi:dipeptidyl-peptidase-4
LKKIILNLFLFSAFASAFGQNEKKDISLEDIWQKGTFRAQYVGGYRPLAKGDEYARIVYSADYRYSYVVKYSYVSGDALDTLINGRKIAQNNDMNRFVFSDYELDKDGKNALIPLNVKRIYRHSSEADFMLLNMATNKLKPITKGKSMYATFSPSGTHIAYVQDNNLYVLGLKKFKTKAVTKDGKKNAIINGAVDWVYEEEFSMDRGYEWNEDGSRIAFYRFDESQVKQWQMPVYGSLYTDYDRFKYPKAGEANSVVDVYVYEVGKRKAKKLETGSENDQYLPRIKWTKDPNMLSIQRLNRLQNHWELIMANADTRELEVVMEEKDDSYVDINDDLHFLKDGKHLIMKSERDGWWHLYLHKINGPQVYQITKGEFEVDQLLGVDEKEGRVYYSSTEIMKPINGRNYDGSVDRHLYSISIDGSKKSLLSKEGGTHTANFSSDHQYYLHTWSSVNQPPYFEICSKDGNAIRLIEDNSALKETLKGYNISQLEFSQLEHKGGNDIYSLNYYTIMPNKIDSSKKLPALMHVYGGPGSQQVRNQWLGANYLWHQMLANRYGYAIIVVDNRGTGGKGEAFKKVTYKQLGKYETEDQILAAKTLPQTLPIDGSRIGIWGWSYGGYMSSLCISKGHDVFKTAIAVAPVTNWRYYDNIYTERYMSTPQLNGQGYDINSPISHVDSIRGNYLIIHGTGDDNVHFENTVMMVDEMVKKDITFDSEFYPNKNHGIYGGLTRLHLYKRMTNYLLEKL